MPKQRTVVSDEQYISNGLLTPKEIQELRCRLNLTRLQLAELTGCGSSSIQRWEAGTSLQNLQADRFLRLLEKPGILKELILLNFEHTMRLSHKQQRRRKG